MAPGLRRREAIPALALASALGVAVFYGGGFNAQPRVIFSGLAAGALVCAFALEPKAAGRLAREPVLIVLWALAAMGAISVVWTTGFEAASLRWAAVTAGFGAVAVVAGLIARRAGGVRAIAAAICVAALAGGAIGLVGAALHAPPIADRIGGSWRPGGALEYSSANALLQVSALPALLSAAYSRNRGVAAAGIAGAAVAAAVLALADSRLELTLGIVICAAALVAPRRTLGSETGPVAFLVALLAVSGLAAHLVAGRFAPLGADGGGAARVVALLVICAGATGAWIGGRELAGRLGSKAVIGAAAVAVVTIAAAAATAPAGGAGPSGYGIEGDGGVLHDRTGLWRAALETFTDHPLRGNGANSFLAASARHQDSGPVRFAHDLPLEMLAELGVAGGLLALLLYVTALAAVWRSRGSPAAWLLGPAVIAFLIANLFDWPWHLAGSGAIWAMALGGVISSFRLTNGEQIGCRSTTEHTRTEPEQKCESLSSS